MSQQSSSVIKRKNADGSISTIINGVEVMREKHIDANAKFIQL